MELIFNLPLKMLNKSITIFLVFCLIYLNVILVVYNLVPSISIFIIKFYMLNSLYLIKNFENVYSLFKIR